MTEKLSDRQYYLATLIRLVHDEDVDRICMTAKQIRVEDTDENIYNKYCENGGMNNDIQR